MVLFSLSNSKSWFWRSSIALAFYSSILFIINSSPLPKCDDPYKTLGLIVNQNGTITRLNEPPHSPPSQNPTLPVLSKDVTINQSKGTWARVFIPRNALNDNSKLPLLVFFHGGGFIFSNAASTPYHNFCFNMANDVGAVVVSISHRLAPEHRLSVAYDDSLEALQWIKTNLDDWLRNHVNYSNVLLVGSSSGGNIVYNVGLTVAAVDESHDEGLKIRGLILIQAFFGGIPRTSSELRLANDSHLTLCATDSLWALSLPVGANRDHPYSNPMVGLGPVRLEKIKQRGWSVLVTGCSGDLLVDRQVWLVNLMKEKGVSVVEYFTPGDYHGVQEQEPLKAKKLFSVIKTFISSLPQWNVAISPASN